MKPSTTKEGGADGADGDVSPMEAQNTGPAKSGPTEAPLREDSPGEPTDARKAPETPIAPGGETATRDDL